MIETRIFTVRMPVELIDQLDAEARREFYKQNARNQMLIKILADRYKTDGEIGDLFTEDESAEDSVAVAA